MGSVIWASHHASVTAKIQMSYMCFTLEMVAASPQALASELDGADLKYPTKAESRSQHIKFGCIGLETKQLRQTTGPFFARTSTELAD